MINAVDQLLLDAADGAPEPEGPPRDHQGRYILPPISGQGDSSSWRRVTTLVSALEDSSGLDKWKQGLVAKGLGFRPDLAALAAAAETSKELAAVTEAARQVAGGDIKSNIGTALHAFIRRAVIDGNLDRVPEQHHPDVQAVLDKLREYGMQVVGHYSERVVLDEAREVAGTFDWLIQLSDGTLCLGDVKTGRLEYLAGKTAAQLASYQRATHARDFERDVWEELPPTRPDFGLVLHVAPGSGVCDVYVVDLKAGRHMADVALQVMQARKVGKAAMWPWQPGQMPAGQLAGAQRWEDNTADINAAVAETKAAVAATVPVQQPMPDGTPGQWVSVEGGWSLQPAAAVEQGPGPAQAPVQRGETVTMLPPTDPSALPDDNDPDVVELTKLSKADLAALADRYGINPRRYKIKVARDIVAARRAGQTTPQASTPAVEPQPGAAPAPAPTPAPVPAPVAAQPPVPVPNPFQTAPAAPAAAPDYLAMIAQAITPGEIAALWESARAAGHIGTLWTATHDKAGLSRINSLNGAQQR